MIYSILICLFSLFALVFVVRKGPRNGSLGLPTAYLLVLFLMHVPGAVANWLSTTLSSQFADTKATAIGIQIAAIGTICFVVGVWLARRKISAASKKEFMAAPQKFLVFCLAGGWCIVFGLSSLLQIPSISAAIDKGAAIWMLGILLGIRAAFQRKSALGMFIWGSAMLVYPLWMLVAGGFLSFGSISIIICLAVLTVTTKNYWRTMLGIVLVTFLGLNIFLSYFQNRDQIRAAVWGGAKMNQRIESSESIAKDFRLFNPNDENQLNSLNDRLNQNYFLGVAAERLKAGEVRYMYGLSIWEGLEALVPRILWPNKPVFAGSPGIVMEMTGLQLSESTSWGVGNVMEFYINFGIAGVIGGFIILGWVIGRLDLLAAAAEQTGNYSKLLQYFLPVVVFVPEEALGATSSSVVAAWIAAIGWGWVWNNWVGISSQRVRKAERTKPLKEQQTGEQENKELAAGKSRLARRQRNPEKAEFAVTGEIKKIPE